MGSKDVGGNGSDLSIRDDLGGAEREDDPFSSDLKFEDSGIRSPVEDKPPQKAEAAKTGVLPPRLVFGEGANEPSGPSPRVLDEENLPSYPLRLGRQHVANDQSIKVAAIWAAVLIAVTIVGIFLFNMVFGSSSGAGFALSASRACAPSRDAIVRASEIEGVSPVAQGLAGRARRSAERTNEDLRALDIPDRNQARAQTMVQSFGPVNATARRLEEQVNGGSVANASQAADALARNYDRFTQAAHRVGVRCGG